MTQILINGVKFNHGMTESKLSDALSGLQDAHCTRNVLLSQLGKSIKSGDIDAQHDLLSAIFDSPGLRLCASIAANKKIKLPKRQPLERCLSVAHSLSFADPLPEVVPVYAKQKSFGKVRMIHDPGLLVRTAQQLALDVMGKYLKPRPYQYTQRGVPPAIAQAKKSIQTGYLYAAHLDIDNCYPSFILEKLAPELPLPTEVVEHAVVGRHLKVKMTTEIPHGKHSLTLPISNLLHMARLGLPQGSACSPIVSIYIMSRLPWSQHDDVVLINYADDFLLLAMSEQQLDEAIEDLGTAVAGLPGGHFKFKIVSFGSVNKGIKFLGHHLRLANGKLTTRPSASNLDSIAEELSDLDDHLSKLQFPIKEQPGKHGITLLAEMVATLEGWLSAFGECDDIDRYAAGYMVAIEHWMDILQVDIAQVKAAIDPSMNYVPSGYAFGHK